MEKYKPLLLSVFILVAYSCKKENTPPQPPEEPAQFWAINLDTTTEYEVWGEIIQNTTIVLKTGERSKVYSPKPGIHSITWKAPNSNDSCNFFYSSNPSTEITLFILGTRSLFSHFSNWEPPGGKAAVRFIEMNGHNKLELVDTQNDTWVIYPSRFSIPAIGFIGDSSNFVNPGTYNLQLYEKNNFLQPSLWKNSVEFKSGEVYFVYQWMNNEITVVKR